MPSNSSASPALLALGCVSFLATASAATAQSTSDSERKLGGVTVTDTAIEADSYRVERASSTKMPEPLLDTPRSITVLPEALLRQTATASLAEALRLVPGITLGAGEGGNPQGDRPFIRGYDAQGSTYIDGIRSIGGQSREIFAIESVEVTKGSDSAIGGRGGAGGTINLVSKRPHAGTDARFEGSYGEGDYKRLTADVNHQLSDTLAVRLNAMWHDQDVAGRDAIKYERWGVAPSITLGLGSPTSATLSWYHLQSDDLPDAGIPFERTQAQAEASGLLNIGPARQVNGVAVPRTAFYGLANRDFRKTNVDELTFRFSHEMSDSVTALFSARYASTQQQYVLSQPDDSQGNVQNGEVWRRANSRWSDVDSFVLQQDFSGSFKTGAVIHNFSVGGEFSVEQSRRGSFVSADGHGAINTSPRCTPDGFAAYNCTSLYTPDPNDPWVNLVNGAPSAIVPSQATGLNTAHNWSLYAFDTMHVTDQLLVNLGGRYDTYRQTQQSGSATSAGFTDRLSVKEDFFTYQVGIVYKPVPNGSFYISHGTSAVPAGASVGEGADDNAIGGGRGTTIDPDNLKAERVKSYEIGTKWDLANGALSLTAALFRTETTNARMANALNVLEYVGHRRVQGVEVSATGRPLPFWNLYAGYTYMDSELRNAGDNPSASVLINVGKPFPNTPKHSFVAQTDVTILDRFTIGGGASYTGKQYGNFGANGVTRSVPGWWRVDLNAAAKLTDAIEVRVNAQNLLNERYYDRTYSTHFVNLAAGRTVTGTLALTF